MKLLSLCIATVLLSSCGLHDMNIRNSNGLVSKSVYKQAIASATLVQDASLRGQILKVSRAEVRGNSYGVLQFVEGLAARNDQPKVADEVIPLAEQLLGCSVPDRRKIDAGIYMPRNTVLVVPLECVDIIDG